MSDETVLKSRIGSIPYADDDTTGTEVAARPVVSWLASKVSTNDEEDASSRNVQNFTTFRVACGSSGIAKRELPTPDGDAMSNRRESPKQRHARQSSVLPRRDRHETAPIEVESALQRYENALLKYQKPKLRPKRQISRDRQQLRQQQSNNYSSSDESVARNKSKSTSSIDTQSVNNILDEYEDLDYRRSSDLSDVGNITVTNFEAVMMDQQKRQQQGRPKLSSAKLQSRSIPTREKIQPVLKVNQQTQVRQRSRDRQRDPGKGHQHILPETETRYAPTTTMGSSETSRTKMPEILLRKGEVQKRVDEWLNQAQSQNFPVTREKPLTRSNSSAEQKSQRRYRQDSRSRSIDEARERLNGASSSYDDLSRMDRKTDKGRSSKVNVGVNTSRAVYKEYLAVKNKHDYGLDAPNASSSRPGDLGPASKIPQRGGALGSSFRSRRVDATTPEEALDERNGRPASHKTTNLARTRNESSDYGRLGTVNSSRMSEAPTVTTMTTTTAASIIPCRRPSLKRPGNNDQNAAATAPRSLVKEETESRSRGACGAGPSKGLGDQGKSISPNKDGESRRPVAASGPPRPADKAAETAASCKSTEAPRCAEHPRDGSRIASPTESSVAIEPTRRRPQQQTADIRSEARIDQARQENAIYGAVGARVRALQAELRAPRARCQVQQVSGAPTESSSSSSKPLVSQRKDHGASPSRDAGSQSRAKAPTSAAMPSSSFKPNNRVYTSASLQQLNERNVARSRVATGDPAPGRPRGYPSSSEHVERIYEQRGPQQPQVIHADDLESVLRPALQMSAYGEKAAAREGRQSPVKETLSAIESEVYERVGESRHPEHLETIEEDDRKSESSICRYPEIGLKQCLKVQQSLANGRSREVSDKRKDSAIYARWDRQVVLNEPVRTFATFQSTPASQGSAKSSAASRPSEIKEARGHEAVGQKTVQPTTVSEDHHLVADYEDTSQQESDRLTIHSRENSNLSTATIPVDELESQRGSRFKSDEVSPSNRFPTDEKSQGRVTEEPARDTDRGAIVNEVLVKNLQFEQGLPGNQTEQSKITDHAAQQVNFHNVLCDDYESGKQKDTKAHLTKELMDHQRLIAMLKKGEFETLKVVSFLHYLPFRASLAELRAKSDNNYIS